jgi:hypothetical protein
MQKTKTFQTFEDLECFAFLYVIIQCASNQLLPTP